MISGTTAPDSATPLTAGAAIIGKVGIDQTTPGTTNGVQLTGSQRTPAASVVTSSGTVVAGKKSVTLIPSNDFTGTILGVDVGAQPLQFDAPPGDTLGAIAYTRTTGSLTILTIT